MGRCSDACGATRPRYQSPKLFAVIALIWVSLSSRAVLGNPSCTVQEDLCWRGTIMNVDFSSRAGVSSLFTGCLPVDPPFHRSCCSLCAQNWPQCKSWMYVKDGNTGDVGGAYDDKQGYCCMFSSYREDEQSSTACSCCDSGYISPECTLTANCNVEVFGGSSLSDSDYLLVKPNGTGMCGDTTAQSWTGLTNPKNASSTQTWFVDNLNGVTYEKQVYNYGAAEKGLVGSFRLCYNTGPGSNSDFATLLGELQMVGPASGQTVDCTLGEECVVQIEGHRFPVPPPGSYRIAAVKPLPGVSDPCGTATISDLPAFAGSFTNPDTLENDPNSVEGEDPFQGKILARMETATSGDTETVLALCWASSPSTDTAIEEYMANVGVLRMNGPAFAGYECTMGLPCTVTVFGRGLADTNAVMIVAGQGAEQCGNFNAFVALFDFFTFGLAVNPALPDTANSSAVTYSFGTFMTGDPMPGEVYRMCWAANPEYPPGHLFAATDSEYYLVDAGIFTLHGPELLGINDFFECVFTMPCVVTVKGSGLRAINGLFLISGECEESLKVPPEADGPTWTNPESATVTGGPDDVYNDAIISVSFGTPTVGKASIDDGDHTVCWGFHPTSENDYSVQVGKFTLNGPNSDSQNDLFGGRSCIKGIPCSIEITGLNLDSNTNKMIIAQNSCNMSADEIADFSLPFLVEQHPNEYTPATPPDSYVYEPGLVGNEKTYDFGIADAGTAGEDYVLCWAHDPSSLLDYTFLISDTTAQFTMIGPNYKDMSCTLGLECKLPISGMHLAATNRIIVQKPGFNCGQNLANQNYADFEGMTARKALPCVNPVNAGGGCPGNSLKAPRPRVTVYDSDNFGGQSWEMDGAGHFCPGVASFPDDTIQSVRVENGDAVVFVLCPTYDACNPSVVNCRANGAKYPKAVLRPGSYNSSQLQALGIPDQSISYIEVREDYGGYHLGTPRTGLPSSDYKVCWAHDPGNPNDATVYRTNVGILTVNGPQQWHLGHTTFGGCVMSLECTLTLTGVGLNGFNRILLVEKFGANDCNNIALLTVANLNGVTNPGVPNEVGQLAITSTTYELGYPGTGDPGSNYWLCWAHNPTTEEDYRTTLGTFSLCGPRVLDEMKECILGVADAPWGPCTLDLTGSCLATTNRIVITRYGDTCGSDNLRVATFVGFENPKLTDSNAPPRRNRYSFGVATSAVPGDYTVCWAHDPHQISDYDVHVGTFRMSGPFQQHTICTLSEPCMISLRGYRFSHFSKVLIVEKPALCGDDITWTGAEPEAPSWGGINNPAASSTLVHTGVGFATYSVGDVGDVYDAGVGFDGKPGRTYSLCWSFAPNNADKGLSYKVPIGDFEVIGPDQVNGVLAQCVLGLQCNVKITGWGLSSENQVLIIGAGRRRHCRDNDVTDAVRYGVDNPLESIPEPAAVLSGINNPRLVTDDAYDNTYAMGLVTVGGSYAACNTANPAPTCIGSFYRLCWSAGLDPSTALYAVEIGNFAMSGPFVTYQVECILGMVCSFKLYGANLAPSNRVMIVEDSSRCGSENAVLAVVPGLVNPQRVAKVGSDLNEETFRLGLATGGAAARYRLCWGFGPKMLKEYNIEIGPFVFGPPPDLCVVENGLTLKCNLPETS